jgi:hypothetical protein
MESIMLIKVSCHQDWIRNIKCGGRDFRKTNKSFLFEPGSKANFVISRFMRNFGRLLFASPIALTKELLAVRLPPHIV